MLPFNFSMIWQTELQLSSFSNGCHLITNKVLAILPVLPESGLLNIFIAHTSAGLAINENADPSVRSDLAETLNHLVPENEDYYTHILEGSDDMPAHTKSILTGCQLTIPVINSRLGLGVWQGIYLCEFRESGGSRKLIITLYS